MPQHAENLRNHEVPSSDHARWQRGTKVEPGWSQSKTLQDTKESPKFLVQKASGTKWSQGGTKEEPRPQQAENQRKTKVLGPERLRGQRGTKVEPRQNPAGNQGTPKVFGTESVRNQVEPRWNQGGTKEEPRPQQAENQRKTKVWGPERPRGQSGTKVEPRWNQGGTKVEPRRNHAEPLGKLRISDSVAPQTWIYYNTN